MPYQHPEDAAREIIIKNKIWKMSIGDLKASRQQFQEELEDTVDDLYSDMENETTEWHIQMYQYLIKFINIELDQRLGEKVTKNSLPS